MKIHIKTLITFFIITLLLSCDSNDGSFNDDPLILKKIESETSHSKYNEKGQFVNNQSINNEDSLVTFDITYNEKNRRSTYFSLLGQTERIREYVYDESGKIIKIKPSSNNQYEEPVLIYSYDSNIITTENQEHKFVFTFEDDTYEVLKRFQTINLSSEEIVFEESYIYINGNLHKNIISIGEDFLNKSGTYKYDNRRNPRAEGDKINFINKILERTYSGSLTTMLSDLGSNNRINVPQSNNKIVLEYNNRNYPIKETVFNQNGDQLSQLIFKYY
ncbi:hypothetical protein [Aquimarina sp. RZ0]|uniref:hypothetical protein n=1 Tax=Aquimarina sp. RZ0 TaxID=2607730 RepID=UPI0011F3CAC0|nr:hypothetical protein [Aquimarina sp. RZ0]KAA1246217.1 hypothetical protein F0000_08765 [Aquimarina sp. RZ0]